MVMHLKTCCCGCTLKTGTVIIGVLSGIGALVGLVVAIMGASVGTGEFQKELIKKMEENKALDPETYNRAIKNLEETSSSNTTLTVICICLAIVNAIHLIVAVMLVYGASAEKARLVKPWIVYSIMSLVVQTILSMVNIIIIFVNGSALGGVLGLVFLAIGVALGVYFILVVNSFHTELTSTNFQNKI